MNVTIGNDVEFILVNKRGPVSSIGIVGGSKSVPSPCDCGALQEDNVLAEINIDPASNVKEWEHNITTVVKQLEMRLPFGVSISTKASAFYNKFELSNPQAQEFGCDPDLNAWSQKFNKFKHLTGKMASLRSAGGHVHVGIPNLSNEDKFSLIRCMDTFIGLQTVILDKDLRRKELYGKAGAMRLKPYGVEWRVPSNFWVHTPLDRKWMFEAAQFVGINFKEIGIPYFLYQNISTEKFINTNDKKRAIFALKKLKKQIDFPLHPSLGG